MSAASLWFSLLCAALSWLQPSRRLPARSCRQLLLCSPSASSEVSACTCAWHHLASSLLPTAIAHPHQPQLCLLSSSSPIPTAVPRSRGARWEPPQRPGEEGALILLFSVAPRKQKQRLEPKHQREQQEGPGQGEGPQVGRQRQRVGAHRPQRQRQRRAQGETWQPAQPQPAQPLLRRAQRPQPPQPPLLRPAGAPTALQPPQAGLQSLRDQRPPGRAPGEGTELGASGADGQPAVLPEGHGQPLRVLR